MNQTNPFSKEMVAEIVTDLSQFGYREKKMAAELLTAYVENPDILGDGVTVAMNVNSGYVFLTDEDYNTAMMNGHKLEQFYSCPICGVEGFLDEIDGHSEDKECVDYIRQIKGLPENEDEEEEVNNQTIQIDEEFVKELVLCAVNDGRIYETCGNSCIENLKKKIKRGVFDETKAPKLFQLRFLELARASYGNGQKMNAAEKELFGKMAYEFYEEEIKA